MVGTAVVIKYIENNLDKSYSSLTEAAYDINVSRTAIKNNLRARKKKNKTINHF